MEPKWGQNGNKNEAEIDIDFGIDFFMIFYSFGSISGSIWESFGSSFWYFFGPGGRSEQKRRFSRNAMNSLCFFDILRVRGVRNLIIFGPGGDFFDVRKSSRILHRFMRVKVRKVRHFGLHFRARGHHLATFSMTFSTSEKGRKI